MRGFLKVQEDVCGIKEKNLTREQVSEKAGVAVSNIVRFEQKGLISLKNVGILADL